MNVKTIYKVLQNVSWFVVLVKVKISKSNYRELHFPRISHHEIEVCVVINTSRNCSIIINEFFFSYLKIKNKKHFTCNFQARCGVHWKAGLGCDVQILSPNKREHLTRSRFQICERVFFWRLFAATLFFFSGHLQPSSNSQHLQSC